MVANYFQPRGDVPPANIPLLQDFKAGRADLEEVLSNWPPLHTAELAVVIVYCSGQARVAPSGDILLVPHNGRTATGHLYPLKNMESALAKLKAKQILFIFDGLVTRLPPKAHAKPAVPQWGVEGENKIRLIGGEELQQGLEDSRHRHGLFTYYLLKGLRGEADTNRNGTVTFSELAGYVRQKVAWAAKTQFNQEQTALAASAAQTGRPSRIARPDRTSFTHLFRSTVIRAIHDGERQEQFGKSVTVLNIKRTDSRSFATGAALHLRIQEGQHPAKGAGIFVFQPRLGHLLPFDTPSIRHTLMPHFPWRFQVPSATGE